MGVTVKEPYDLRTILATMKAALEQDVSMIIWSRDIKVVEDSIATIDAIRNLSKPTKP